MVTSFEKYSKFIGRTFIVPGLWVLYFILTFRVLSRYPLGIYMDVIEISFLFFLFSVSVVEFIRLFLAKKVDYLFLLLLPLMILPFLNAIQAKKVFGQPLLYGIVSQREVYLLLVSYFMAKVLIRGWVTLKNLERYFLYGILVILYIMLFFYIFINPAIYAGSDFVQDALTKGWLYQFPNGIAAAVIFYSLLKIWLENKTVYYIHLMAALLFFIVYAQDRSQIAFIGITSAFIFIKDLNVQRKIINLLYSTFLLIFASVILISIKPNIFNKYFQLYTNASAIFTGDNPHESSTQIRFYESDIALSGFKKHPLMGDGYLSIQWKNGYLGQYGYFYPSDVGLLGNLYAYGIIGTIFFYIPILAALRWGWQMRKIKDPFLMTIFYTFIFTFLDMFTAASNIILIGLPMFCIGVIYYYRFYVFKKTLGIPHYEQSGELETVETPLKLK